MAVTVGDLLVRLRANTTDFSTKMAAAGKRMQTFGTNMSALGSKIAIGLGVPLALIGAKAAKSAMEVETNFAHIRGLVGASQETLDQFANSMDGIGKVTGKTGSELSKAAFFITSAGLKGERAAAGVEALKASALGAAAGLGDTAVVADAATSAMNAYGEANMSAEQAVAILVGTVREGKAEASSIAPVLGRLLPVASELGVGFDQVGAALAAMTRLGFDAATSATSIRATMVAMLKPAQQAEEALEEYGLSFADLRKELREKGMISVLMKLKNAFGENETAMAQVFPNVRALAGILSLVGENAEASEQVFASLAKTTKKDLYDAFEAVENTARMNLDKAMQAISSTFRKLGEDILPVVIPMIQGIASWIQKAGDVFQNLNPRIQQAIIVFGAVVTVLGPVLVILGALISSIGTITTAVAAMTAKFAISTPIISANSAALTANARASQQMARNALAAKVSLVVLAGYMGYMIGTIFRPYIEELLGIDDALFKVAEKSKDLEQGLAGSEKAFRSQMNAYQELIKRLKLSGDEWRVQAEWTEENAKRLSTLTEKAIEYARANRTVGDTLKKNQEIENDGSAQKRINELLAKKKAQEEYVANLKEEYDIQTKGDIVPNLQKMVKEYNALKDAGADQVQLAEEFGQKLLDQVAIADRNKVALPAGVTAMAKALNEQVDPALKKQMTNLSERLPGHINVMGGKVIDGMVKVGGKVATELSGGFQKGFESAGEKSDILKAALKSQVENGVKEGVVLGEDELAQMRARQKAEVLTVEVVGDWTAFDEQRKYRSTGYVPETGEAGQP
jgi:TP901 family phage tail tape measure protein